MNERFETSNGFPAIIRHPARGHPAAARYLEAGDLKTRRGHEARVHRERLTVRRTIAALLALGFGLAAHAQQAAKPAPQFDTGDGAAAETAAEFRTLDEEVQELKKLAVDLNRDLFLLEEELLFPSSTQVAVFVSMDVGEFFALDSIEIELDGKNVTSYLYTDREVDALYRGGVQRLFAGNLRAGEHELVAFFTGEGPHERPYRRGASLEFEKGIGPKHIELKISDRESRLQPEFVVVEWE